MNVRNSSLPKPIFYRGISLKEYIRKSSVFHRPLHHREEDTIIVDENKNPIPFQEGFMIFTQPKEPNLKQNTSPRDSSIFADLPSQYSNKELPSLHSKRRRINRQANDQVSGRNKTDVSAINPLQMKLDLLPSLTRNKIRNVTDQSDLQPRSQRKKKSERIIKIEELNEQVFVMNKQKAISSRQKSEAMRYQIMLKNRYNVRNGKMNNKLKHNDRVKSYAQ